MARRSKAARAVSLWRRSQNVLASLGLGPASRGAPSSADAHRGPRLTLFDQRALPPALRLPRPADPVARVGAGLADLALACTGGGAASALAVGVAGAPPEVGFAAAQATAICLFALRDALGDEGNRSVGKALFGLEICLWDGSLAPPAACAARSWYLGLAPLAGLHSLLAVALELGLFFDLASLALTPDARKAGDYVFGTRVVEERPGRAERVLDMREQAEALELRAEIEAIAPGTMAARAAEAEAAEASASAAAAARGGAATKSVREPVAEPIVAAELPPLTSLSSVFSEVRGQNEFEREKRA